MYKLLIPFVFAPLTVLGQESPPEDSLLATLSQKDTLTILFSRASSFPYRNSIKFYYQNGKLKAETTHLNALVTTEVNAEKRAFAIELEKEGWKHDDRSKVCYNADGYVYLINQEFKYQIFDHTCQWFGFEKLTEKLFGF